MPKHNAMSEQEVQDLLICVEDSFGQGNTATPILAPPLVLTPDSESPTQKSPTVNPDHNPLRFFRFQVRMSFLCVNVPHLVLKTARLHG